MPVSPMQMDNAMRDREAMEPFSLAPGSEPLLRKLTEVSKAIAELMVGRTPGPDGEAS